jgi:glycosyltransferase involved in cell wall biosynthesis
MQPSNVRCGIVFAHLLNDRSGSPKVLGEAIRVAAAAGLRGRLFVARSGGGGGSLDDAPVEISHYWYERSPYRLVTFAAYIASQMGLFVKLLGARDIAPNAVVYVNTLLPFGAAIYGRLTGRRVVYHLHEISLSPAVLLWALVSIARFTADELVYVSDFHRRALPIAGVRSRTVHNAVDQQLADLAGRVPYCPERQGCFRVLMLASLRDYKGIPEYIGLASRFSGTAGIEFHIIANDESLAIERYFSRFKLPPNLHIHQPTANPSHHYATASLVLNLSRPDAWVETFGLTILEALTFGIPVIAPPVGAPPEIVQDGVEGFLVDCRNSPALDEKVRLLLSDHALCMRMSEAAYRRAGAFSQECFSSGIRAAMNLVSVRAKLP